MCYDNIFFRKCNPDFVENAHFMLVKIVKRKVRLKDLRNLFLNKIEG